MPGIAKIKEDFKERSPGRVDSRNNSVGRRSRIFHKLGRAKNQPPQIATSKARTMLCGWSDASRAMGTNSLKTVESKGMIKKQMKIVGKAAAIPKIDNCMR